MKRPRHPRIVSVRMALDVTPEAARILDGQSRIANWLWNDLLETCTARKADLTAGTDTDANLAYLYSRYAIRNAMVERKTTAAWLCSLHSSVRQEELVPVISEDPSDEPPRGGSPIGLPSSRSWKATSVPGSGTHEHGRSSTPINPSCRTG